MQSSIAIARREILAMGCGGCSFVDYLVLKVPRKAFRAQHTSFWNPLDFIIIVIVILAAFFA